jgi:hypothetical protein
MYPPRQPDARRILASPDALRADVQDFLRKLPPQGSAVWVISEFNTFPQGTPHLSEPDLLLVRQLQGSGLEFSPVEMSLGIFRFHQP